MNRGRSGPVAMVACVVLALSTPSVVDGQRGAVYPVVFAWGDNEFGQVGDGSTADRWWPIRVSRLTEVTAVAGGYNHSLALKSDGMVSAWGYNGYGQLGDGTTTDSSTPVRVAGLTDVTAVAAGGSHLLALKSDGTVWAWGYNDYGPVGRRKAQYSF